MGDPPKPWVSICFNTQIAEIWMNWGTPQLPRPLCMKTAELEPLGTWI